MAKYQYAISTTSEGLHYLFDLGITAPRHTPQKYSKYMSLGDGGVRGFGYGVVEWFWAFITQAEIDALRVYCPDTSADVHVRTPSENNDWTTYLAKMLWPTDPPDIQNGDYVKFAIQFRLIEEL